MRQLRGEQVCGGILQDHHPPHSHGPPLPITFPRPHLCRRKYGTLPALPHFNPIHMLAVHAWLAHRLDVGGALVRGSSGGEQGASDASEEEARWDGYAVFQWRSETVNQRIMEGCARNMSKIAKKALGALRSVTRAGGVLAADLPAPRNPCAQWHVYAGSFSDGEGTRRRSLTSLMSVGLSKYDDDHPGVDAGVLSIRCAASHATGVLLTSPARVPPLVAILSVACVCVLMRLCVHAPQCARASVRTRLCVHARLQTRSPPLQGLDSCCKRALVHLVPLQ